MLRGRHQRELHVLPVLDVGASDAHDPVARLDARHRARRRLLHIADDRVEALQHRHLDPDHEQTGDQQDRQHDVHRRPRQVDENPLPARLVEKIPRIVADLVGVLAAKPHVAAQGHQGDAIVGLAAPEAP